LFNVCKLFLHTTKYPEFDQENRFMKKFALLPLLLVGALLAAACAPAAVPAAAPAAAEPAATEAATAEAMATEMPAEEMAAMDIVDTAVGAGTFTTLVAAVEAAGLVDTLKGEGPFTVFAPTDDAFAALPEGAVEALLADPEALAQVLLYHVVPGAVMAANVTDGLEAATAQGGSVKFAVADGAVKINEANVVATDIVASNGVIHVIDAVILPPAPAAEAASEETVSAASAGTIVDIAVANPDFSTLVTAVTEAGLVEVLAGEGPFTVFAPTNEAFAKIDPAQLEAILADKELLTAILTYHVVPGAVMAADVTDGLEATTVQGGIVTFAVSDTGVMINEANIVATDIAASNGVIHVIDTVIVPE
jgi:uncharacterized surface protein with fasciclin (FAS1) repeats